MSRMSNNDKKGLTWQEIGSIIMVFLILYSIWHELLADGKVL